MPTEPRRPASELRDMTALAGAGLGLRRELLPELLSGLPDEIRFLELAPENWMERGGAAADTLRRLARERPLVCHGLSLSLGGPSPLDEGFLRRVKRFLDRYRVTLYTEHLSFCADDGHVYDLLPIPFTGDAVRHVARRIRRAQDILERRIAIENASFYLRSPIDEMDEGAFVRAVLDEAGCDLHLDVNNVYVNSVNHGYDPYAFIAGLPPERVVYLHVAGHDRHSPGLLVDTHGTDVADAVWALLRTVYRTMGVRPTLLERDFNIPPLTELVRDLRRIEALQREAEAA